MGTSILNLTSTLVAINMDGIVNKGKQMLSGNKSSSDKPAGQGQGGQDYVDKGINSVQDKLGMDKDHKYDKYEEKATDLARGQYEKSTGKKVSSKVWHPNSRTRVARPLTQYHRSPTRYKLAISCVARQMEYRKKG